MARRRTNSGRSLVPEAATLRFDQKLVLLRWMLWLFDKTNFNQLAEPLKAPELEGLNEDNNHKSLQVFRALWELEEFPGDTLLGDDNIVKHTLKLNEGRAVPIRWKYFQWLALLFTEVYLDRFFRDPERLLKDLNGFVERFNAENGFRSGTRASSGGTAEVSRLRLHLITPYEPGDRRKLAF